MPFHLTVEKEKEVTSIVNEISLTFGKKERKASMVSIVKPSQCIIHFQSIRNEDKRKTEI